MTNPLREPSTWTSFSTETGSSPATACPSPIRSIARRPFLAFPLRELAPDLVLPDSGRRLNEVVGAMTAGGLEPLADFTRALKKEILP